MHGWELRLELIEEVMVPIATRDSSVSPTETSGTFDRSVVEVRLTDLASTKPVPTSHMGVATTGWLHGKE
jgi:hypothetical protein